MEESAGGESRTQREWIAHSSWFCDWNRSTTEQIGSIDVSNGFAVHEYCTSMKYNYIIRGITSRKFRSRSREEKSCRHRKEWSGKERKGKESQQRWWGFEEHEMQ